LAFAALALAVFGAIECPPGLRYFKPIYLRVRKPIHLTVRVTIAFFDRGVSIISVDLFSMFRNTRNTRRAH